MCKKTFSNRKQIVVAWGGEDRDSWELEPEAIFKGYCYVHHFVYFRDICIC